jgi:hypothetical protein
MNRSIARVMTCIVLVSSGAVTAAAPSAPAAPNRAVYTSIKELMDSIIDPSADVVWQAVGTVVDNKGFHDALPKTAEDWGMVRAAAVRLIEGSNLLMMPGRAAAPPGTKSEVPGVELEPAEIAALIAKNRTGFDSFALALQQVAARALRASDAKNGAMLMDAGGDMEEACEGCHQSFWYPNAANPQPAGPARGARR